MSSPFKLTLKDVLIAGRKAIDAGQLAALAKDQDAKTHGCQNKVECNGRTYYCVIGSALPDSIRDERSDTLSALIRKGYVIVEDAKEREILEDLQIRHDNGTTTAQGRKKFTDQFRKLEIRYGLRPARAA